MKRHSMALGWALPSLPAREPRAETCSLPPPLPCGPCRGLQGGEKTALPWLCLFLLEQIQ